MLESMAGHYIVLYNLVPPPTARRILSKKVKKLS